MSLVGCNNQNQTKEQSSISKTTSKEDYELQEQCGKRSEEFFRKKFKYSKPFLHQNHYNKKLNKCFILARYLDEQKYLYDVNENKRYGVFYKNPSTPKEIDFVLCEVLEKECKSVSEFDSLVKPYMKE